MTNETTASQPKSIGDDALEKLVREYGNVPLTDGNKRGFRLRKHVMADILTLIDSRAPAAQASATIQAAPTFECSACHGSGWVSRDPDIGTEQECFSCGGSGEDEEAALIAQAASIQEPVMVAEPVGKIKELAEALTVEYSPILITWDALIWVVKCLVKSISAAPMVADPAGAAFDREEFIRQVSVGIAEMDRDSPEGQPEMMLVTPDELQNTMRSVFDRFDDVAATVKAVPSEALDAARYRWLRSVGPEQQSVIAHYAMECMDERVDHFRLAVPLADKTGGGE